MKKLGRIIVGVLSALGLAFLYLFFSPILPELPREVTATYVVTICGDPVGLIIVFNDGDSFKHSMSKLVGGKLEPNLVPDEIANLPQTDDFKIEIIPVVGAICVNKPRPRPINANPDII